MNRLEELAGSLTAAARWVESGVASPHDAKRMREAAAILLAASKVDVAGLMALFEARQRALDSVRDAKTKDIADNAILQVGYADIALETALRLALAAREWQGLTTEDTMTAIVINQGGEEFVKGLRWAEAKLKEKNAGGTND